MGLIRPFISLGVAVERINRKWSKRFPAWRGGVVAFCALATLVFFINLSAFIWAIRNLDESPFATLAIGSCKNIGIRSFWFHLAINIFSALLLSGSNYCMQCLSSPTRKEIDDAHSEHTYMGIGTFSFRNLMRFRKRRLCVIALLLLSSLPLHLVYNSTVVTTNALQIFDMVVVTEEFLTGGAWSQHGTLNYEDLTVEGQLRYLQGLVMNDKFNNVSRWRNLTTAECKEHYDYSWQSDLGSVLLVTQDEYQEQGHNETVLWYNFVRPGIERVLGRRSDQSFEGWMSQRSRISYCMSLEVPGRCRLQVHVWLLLTVIVFNAVKIQCMLITLREQRGAPLVTTGDAISTFLETPCLKTSGLCLYSVEDFKKLLKARRLEDYEVNEIYPKRWQRKYLYYFQSDSLRRWVIYISSCLLMLAITGYYSQEIRGDQIFDTPVRRLWETGLGRLSEDSRTYVLPPSCYLARFQYRLSLSTVDPGCFNEPHELYNLMIGSLPQFLVSVIYIALNHHLTTMIQLRDWTHLIAGRQSLRISDPIPGSKQISTYWLSLPCKYSIPQIISSIVLGWLVSQGIFFYRLKWYDNNGSLVPRISTLPLSVPNGYEYGLGYSALGVVCCLAFGALVFAVSVALIFCKCPPGLPLGPRNSLVVAAACHPPENGRYAGRKLVQWGVVSSEVRTRSDIGHCTITSRKVEAPVEGQRYA